MEVNFISTYVALESQGHLTANRVISVSVCIIITLDHRKDNANIPTKWYCDKCLYKCKCVQLQIIS